jgi:CheY-like chemotaxis protein
VNLLVLVVDDEPDVEMLFRQQFRHDLRVARFTMEFAPSGEKALQRIADARDVSIILIPIRHQYAGDDRFGTAAQSQGGAA